MPEQIDTPEECRKRKNRERMQKWRSANRDKDRERKTRWREANRESERAKNAARYRANPEKVRERSRAWRKANLERSREADRNWAIANPERRRAAVRKHRYGITQEQWNALFVAQDRSCAVCSATEPGAKHGGWHTDHCHNKKHIRGILCHHCNLMLGNAKDNPERLEAAARYLRSNPHEQPERQDGRACG